MLILDIFAQRAQSRDGKLQVELAQLNYRAAAPAREEHDDEPADRRHRRPRPRRDQARDRTGAARASASTAWRRRSSASAQQRAGAPVRAHAARPADRRHRRLHQRRQVHAAQHAHRAATCWPRTSCSPRSTRRRAGCASRASSESSSPTRSASSATCRSDLVARLPRHARGAGRGRPAAARRRRRRPGARAADGRGRAILADLGLAETPRILVMNKVDLLPEDERARIGGSGRRSAGGRDLRAGRRHDDAAAGGDRSRPVQRRHRDPAPRRRRRRGEPAVMSFLRVPSDRRRRGAAGRAHPRARARPLRVREAVRRQGAAVLARLRPASCSASRGARPNTACR